MTDLISIASMGFWCGVASLGFGVLFNTPPRTLFALWVGGFIAGCIKFSILELASGGIVMASFMGALAVGILSIPVAHFRHVPPMIFSIPSVIPLVPGVFAYRTMLGLIRLSRPSEVDYGSLAETTVHNGVNTLFVIMSLALGVAIPMHVMRKQSVKEIRWRR